jgi:hypothetical protein
MHIFAGILKRTFGADPSPKTLWLWALPVLSEWVNYSGGSPAKYNSRGEDEVFWINTLQSRRSFQTRLNVLLVLVYRMNHSTRCKQLSNSCCGIAPCDSIYYCSEPSRGVSPLESSEAAEVLTLCISIDCEDVVNHIELASYIQ